VAAAVFSSILVVALIAGWIVKIRRLARLEVTEDAIRYVQPNGQVSTLSRQQGDELGFVKRHAAALSRIWTLGLTIVDTDAVITLLGFFLAMRCGRRAALAAGASMTRSSASGGSGILDNYSSPSRRSPESVGLRFGGITRSRACPSRSSLAA
jgi:hypothetical protein